MINNKQGRERKKAILTLWNISVITRYAHLNAEQTWCKYHNN
jgi:hypothetical protein